MVKKRPCVNTATIQKHVEAFQRFMCTVQAGFEKGARTHGEGSNLKMNLICEMQDEIRDLACYAFFQWTKLEELKRKMEALK